MLTSLILYLPTLLVARLAFGMSSDLQAVQGSMQRLFQSAADRQTTPEGLAVAPAHKALPSLTGW